MDARGPHERVQEISFGYREMPVTSEVLNRSPVTLARNVRIAVPYPAETSRQAAIARGL